MSMDLGQFYKVTEEPVEENWEYEGLRKTYSIIIDRLSSKT